MSRAEPTLGPLRLAFRGELCELSALCGLFIPRGLQRPRSAGVPLERDSISFHYCAGSTRCHSLFLNKKSLPLPPGGVPRERSVRVFDPQRDAGQTAGQFDHAAGIPERSGGKDGYGLLNRARLRNFQKFRKRTAGFTVTNPWRLRNRFALLERDSISFHYCAGSTRCRFLFLNEVNTTGGTTFAGAG